MTDHFLQQKEEEENEQQQEQKKKTIFNSERVSHLQVGRRWTDIVASSFFKKNFHFALDLRKASTNANDMEFSSSSW